MLGGKSSMTETPALSVRPVTARPEITAPVVPSAS